MAKKGAIIRKYKLDNLGLLNIKERTDLLNSTLLMPSDMTGNLARLYMHYMEYNQISTKKELWYIYCDAENTPIKNLHQLNFVRFMRMCNSYKYFGFRNQ